MYWLIQPLHGCTGDCYVCIGSSSHFVCPYPSDHWSTLILTAWPCLNFHWNNVLIMYLAIFVHTLNLSLSLSQNIHRRPQFGCSSGSLHARHRLDPVWNGDIPFFWFHSDERCVWPGSNPAVLRQWLHPPDRVIHDYVMITSSQISHTHTHTTHTTPESYTHT